MRKRIQVFLLTFALVIPLCGWPSCSGTQQEKALRGVNNIYDAAIGAGKILKGFHTAGSLNDDGYRASLLALRDTKEVLREFTETLADMPVVDGNNKEIVKVFITRAGESLKRLAQVGALHLPADKAQQFSLIVNVGVEATLTIYNFINAIKRPTTLPPLPAKAMDGTDIHAWLQAEVN